MLLKVIQYRYRLGVTLLDPGIWLIDNSSSMDGDFIEVEATRLWQTQFTANADV